MRSICPAVQQYSQPCVQHRSGVEVESDIQDTESRQQLFPDCPVCLASVPAGGQAAMRFAEDAAQCDALGDALADALGLCPSHARLVAQSPQHSTAAARLMARALQRARGLLQAVAAHDALAEEALFRASDACPICRMHEYDAARLAGRFAKQVASTPGQASPLCRPHFEALARLAAPQLRTHLSQVQRRMLHTAIATLRRAVSGRSAEYDLTDPSVQSALNTTVLMSVGRPLAQSPVPGGIGTIVGDAAGMCDELRAVPDGECGCPVCVATRSATEKWLTMLPAAVRFEQDWWLTFPNCLQHVGMCLRSGDPRVATVAAMCAARAALERLGIDAAMSTSGEQQGTQQRVPPDSGRAADKSATRRARRPAVRIVRCPGCERAAVARDRAVTQLLESLKSASCRTSFEQGYGLCLKHFAQAYIFAPEGVVRDALVAIHREKLATLERSLQDGLNSACTDAGSGLPAEVPWRAALYRFSGCAEG
jgi:hypothetical protein